MLFINQVWRTIQLFSSSSTTQKYLQKCYKNYPIEKSNLFSFQNCSTFIYYLEFAQTYYKQSEDCPLTLRPILQFYGYINLLKACLLTIDPNYPSTTTLLSHGVTTRKRKKHHYQFLKDEVKIQKNGLFSYMGENMFHVKHLEGEKITMEKLLCQIPELLNERSYFHLEKNFKVTRISDLEYSTTNKVLDSFHFTASRFENYLNESYRLALQVKEEKNTLLFQLETPLTYNYHNPFMYNILNKEFYFPSNKDLNYPQFGEIMTHYLLLYNLSMIARYETEWWMELVKTTPNEDFPLIQAFLDITQVKGPFLISKWLLEERNYIS